MKGSFDPQGGLDPRVENQYSRSSFSKELIADGQDLETNSKSKCPCRVQASSVMIRIPYAAHAPLLKEKVGSLDHEAYAVA